ncbi:uncharacterized protein [Onthophagus taurus]|uniref:uncharacterized protein n=1 Tax=Onthophagus taurus TaxID=166361 RepID=UPI0039BE95A1
MEGLDIDMEDLESRLYSQVYHSPAENNNPQTQKQETPTNVIAEFKRPSRYFQIPIKKPVVTAPPEFIPLSTNQEIRDIQENTHRTIFNNRYYKGIDMMEPPVISPFQPHNNFIIVPPIVPTQIISPNVFPNKNFEKYLKRQEKVEAKKQKNLEKRKRYKQKKMLRRQQMKEEALALKALIQQEKNEVESKTTDNNKVFIEHSLTVKPLSRDSRNNSVIVLSESDNNSDCEEILEKREVVELSSDDDVKQEETRPLDTSTPDPTLNSIKTEPGSSDSLNTSKTDDDVIFIEPESKHIEVIEIDCDSVSASLKDDEKHSETASTNSDIKIPNIPQMRLRRELRTPDSASNDFLDNSVDVNNSKFNFSLHGSDFRNTNNSSKNVIDMSETDSTTSDATLPKTNHFNTVDFETPTKRFFDDTNLESFGNYITPSRDNSNRVEKDSFEQVCTLASQRHTVAATNSSSDDSSSESDYEENKVSCLNSKQLPQLSSVNRDNDLDVVEPDKTLGDSSLSITKLVTEEIPSTSQLDQTLIETKKRKSESLDTSTSKKRKTQNQNDTTIEDKDKNNDTVISDIDIESNPNFIIIDETFCNEPNAQNSDDDDTESYFSCDDFNNITSDLKLGNCQEETKRRGEDKGIKEKKIPQQPVASNSVNRGGEEKIDYLNFSVEKVQQTMSDNPDDWKILDIDRLHFRYETPRGPRCHRCREVGHMALHCTNKQGPRPCILCGERGHQDPRCPLAMCTSCGNLGGHTTYCSRCAHWQKVQCHLCKLYGHIDSVCPDLWRRYHLTTKPGPIVKPREETFKDERDRWCALCSKSGHLENKCRRGNRTHPVTNPQIQFYVDLYNFPKDQPFIYHKEDELESENINSNEANKVAPEECSFHDAQTGSPDKIIEEKLKNQKKNEQNMYFNVDFPPTKFIPNYFLKQINYLKGKYLGGENTSTGCRVESRNGVDSDEVLFKKPVSLQEYISLESKPTPQENGANNFIDDLLKMNDDNVEIYNSPYKVPVIKYQRNLTGYDETLKLNYLQFAYMNTDQGLCFINSLRRRRGLQLIVDKYDDSPGGEIFLKSSLEIDVKNVREEILRYLGDMPSIHELPQQSKQMLDFLIKHKETLDKAEGNCWTLCKRLCKLSDDSRKAGYNQETAKLRDNMQTTIQLLLFGKLNVGQGSNHVKNINVWINRLQSKLNYKMPLNDIYNIQHSYSYLFEPRKSIMPFKHICSKYDHYISPSVESSNQKRRKIPFKNRIYFENKRKYVIDTCKRYNFPNKFLTELKSIQNAMESSEYSRVHYGHFLKFMAKFRSYMKKQRIS